MQDSTTTEQPKAKRAKREQAPLHPNPRIAKALAAGDKDRYSSMEAWGKSHGLTMAERRACRQLFRDLGEGVGRGRRYENSSTAKVTNASRRVQAAQAKAAKQAKATPKAEPAKEPVAAGSEEATA
jgi:hypothetical protein